MAQKTVTVGQDCPKMAAVSSKPAHFDLHHQDGVFSNTFQAKACFVVNPEWLSEEVDGPEPVPLSRPPWSWEQPRYRVNLQTPITYRSPAEAPRDGPGSGVEPEKWTPLYTDPQPRDTCPLGQAKFRNYIFTHPCPAEASSLHHAQDICVPKN